MGGGKAGNFGNTFGQKLDMLSDALTAASLIPGVDTIADLAAIPVDALRKDFVSVGLDALGVIPLVGAIGDAAKIAKASSAVKPVVKIPKLHKSPSKLVKNGWKEITPEAMKKNTTSRMLKKNGYTIRFDKGTKGMSGYGGKDHYHILNPNSTGKHDYYLDKFGNSVPKNSKRSHIIP